MDQNILNYLQSTDGAMYAGNISVYLSKSYISLHNKNSIIPDKKLDIHGIFGKNKYAVLNPEYFSDMP